MWRSIIYVINESKTYKVVIYIYLCIYIHYVFTRTCLWFWSRYGCSPKKNQLEIGGMLDGCWCACQKALHVTYKYVHIDYVYNSIRFDLIRFCMFTALTIAKLTSKLNNIYMEPNKWKKLYCDINRKFRHWIFF